jgi:hypothetical protein
MYLIGARPELGEFGLDGRLADHTVVDQKMAARRRSTSDRLEADGRQPVEQPLPAPDDRRCDDKPELVEDVGSEQFPPPGEACGRPRLFVFRALLQHPAVAVLVVEKRVRVPASDSTGNRAVPRPARTHLDPPLHEPSVGWSAGPRAGHGQATGRPARVRSRSPRPARPYGPVARRTTRPDQGPAGSSPGTGACATGSSRERR